MPLGEWVLRKACSEAAGWSKDVRVAVNLSPAQFKSRNLATAVALALSAPGQAGSIGVIEHFNIVEGVYLVDQLRRARAGVGS